MSSVDPVDVQRRVEVLEQMVGSLKRKLDSIDNNTSHMASTMYNITEFQTQMNRNNETAIQHLAEVVRDTNNRVHHFTQGGINCVVGVPSQQVIQNVVPVTNMYTFGNFGAPAPGGPYNFSFTPSPLPQTSRSRKK